VVTVDDSRPADLARRSIKIGKLAMRNRITYGFALLLLPLACAAAPQAKTASPASVVVESIQTATLGSETRVTIVVRGKAEPRLTVRDRSVVLQLASARPGQDLAAHMSSGGIVKCVGFKTGAAVAEGPPEDSQISLELTGPADAAIAPGSDPRIVTVRLVPRSNAAASPVTHADGSRLFDIAAYQTDVSLLLRSLAQEANCNILLSDKVTNKVTINLHQVELAKAVDLITRSAGLVVKRDGDTYLVSEAEDPKNRTQPPVLGTIGAGQSAAPGDPAVHKIDPATAVYEVIHCRYILASDLASTLSKMFPPEELKITLGAATFVPKLDNSATTAAVTGIEANYGKAGDKAEPGSNSHDVVLYGEPDVVARAMALTKRLDARRPQLRIGVSITDVSDDGLRNLGLQWNWSSLNIRENPGSGQGINFGTFTHDPVNVTATLSALEQNNKAKLLASPTLSMLDGERSFMLIGDRLIYPKLIGYTQAQTPIFDKEEARVGIYLQVAAQTVSDTEMLITIYPQVSVVTGYLNVNGASYPQISTREQQTTIRVKDGQKIVVGGLIRDEDIKNIQRVPILSKIPLFGELFTWRSTTHNKSEVIVIITPEILKD